MQYASLGIRVNAVCPGVIDTPINQESRSSYTEELISWHPLGRVGTVEEVAKAVVWLCSDEASFITGAVLPIDGGNSARI